MKCASKQGAERDLSRPCQHVFLRRSAAGVFFLDQELTSLWRASRVPAFDKLREPVHVDVAIIGAGITGHRRESCRRRSHRQHHPHITEAADVRYHTIAGTFGKDGARLVARAARAAIDQIDSLVRGLSIDCAFRRLPGYPYTEKRSFVGEVKREALAAADRVWRPVLSKTSLCPSRRAARRGSRIRRSLIRSITCSGWPGASRAMEAFSSTARAVEIREGEPCTIECERGSLSAGSVFMATNVPIAGFPSPPARSVTNRTYALALRPMPTIPTACSGIPPILTSTRDGRGPPRERS